MSDITPGTYIIYNRALDPKGNKLAIALEGPNQAVQVHLLDSSPKQVWIVGTFPDTNARMVIPYTREDLQLGGGASVTAVPGRGSIWLIRHNAADGYTIRNSVDDVNTTWEIDAVDGAKVTFGTDTGKVEQRWICEAVSK